MRFASGGQHATLFAAVIVFATTSVAYGQRPNADDIIACNVEAQRAVSARTASADSPQPNTKDHSRAAEARTETTAQIAGGGTKSDDPQLAGMTIEGAKDPAYQAAYRTCMRKAGF